MNKTVAKRPSQLVREIVKLAGKAGINIIGLINQIVIEWELLTTI